ncbi:hypothetical protein [Kitasatospora sp. NPDC127060]|uniref:hypothetical protein n=1 Tax=Kitasatospora sp. NPDC127060 TaxID=3347121 RepID=UPI0036645F27
MSANAILASRPPVARPRPAAGRRWLRAVPSQQDSPEALLLGEPMRLRLEAAVRGLLADESVAGLPDAARLAAVVLLARGSVEWGVTTLWSGELARWLGVSVSMVSHKVLPPLRSRGVIKTREHVDEDGHVVALDLRLEPVARVRHARDRRHPLALNRDELATLLRLCEALFGPGWEPKDKPAIPPGLLAERDRRGHGAATDRLALLLLVLSCRENGWLKLCSGSLKSPKLGRGAATLALLLRGGKSKVSPGVASRVLGRLQAEGLVEVELEDGEGAPTGRVRLLPIAEKRAEVLAAAKKPASSGATRRAGTRVVRPVEPPAAEACPNSEDSVQAQAASLSAPESADGDLGRPQVPADGPAGLRPAQMAGSEDVSADSESADFHARHALVADVDGCAEEVDGDSGACAVGVTHHRPERAGPREDAAAPEVPALRLVGAAGPLRGEQHQHDDQHNHQEQPEVRATPIVALPQDAALACALAPVQDLWQRLERPSTRGFLLKCVRRALDGIAAWTGPTDAPEVLADRLLFRLKRQRRQGNPHIDDVVAWMLERGLPQERQCKHPACDNGVRLDTDKDCVTCDLRLEDRRSTRRVIIGQVVRQLPSATFEQRREAIEDALRSHALVRAEAQADAARRAAEAQALWEAQRPEREAAAAEAERVRLAVPCEDCGAEQAAGLCGGCARGREIRQGTKACISMVLAAFADLGNYDSVRRAWDLTRAEVRQARQEARLGAANEVIGGAAEVLAVQHALDGYRASALRAFARSKSACEEAVAAYEAVMRARHRFPSEAAVRRCATERSEEARARAAEWLLRRRLAAVEQHLARVAARQEQGGAVVPADLNVVGANRTRDAVNARRAAALARQGS